MAVWTSIFDLGEWEIYVSFKSTLEVPTPDSRAYWVKAEELDPEVGTISVVNGEIVCELGDRSGSAGRMISVVVLPAGWSPDESAVRVSAVEVQGPDRYPFVGTVEDSNATFYGYVPAMLTVGAGTYEPDTSSLEEKLAAGAELLEVEIPEALPTGYGAYVTKNDAGF